VRHSSWDYDDVSQEFVNAAIADYQAHLCAESPMPDHAQEMVLLNASWGKVVQTTGVNLVWRPQLTKLITHRRFQHFLAVYSAIQMTNDSFKFYFHILLEIKFETVVVDKILHKIRPVVWHVMRNKMINK